MSSSEFRKLLLQLWWPTANLCNYENKGFMVTIYFRLTEKVTGKVTNSLASQEVITSDSCTLQDIKILYKQGLSICKSMILLHLHMEIFLSLTPSLIVTLMLILQMN